ncbi:hypothetical protein YN1_8210 [Nanoarchaeota archaeon]
MEKKVGTVAYLLDFYGKHSQIQSIENQNVPNDINKLKEELDKVNQRIYNIEQKLNKI